jgi:hypothetical protein
MVKTPFHDLGSVEILSAHISGLQHAVNKLEEILDLETETVSGLVLTPVADQDDPSLHYRIYEGSVRNWLEDPAPVVYRDGDVVPQDEYDIYPAYGAVIFHEPQGAEAVITADVTYVKAASARLGQYDEALSWIEPALDWLLGHLILHRPGFWRANNVTSSDLVPSATLANVLDVVPFLVLTQTRFDRIAINVSTAGAAGTQARLGIYRDNGSSTGSFRSTVPSRPTPPASGSSRSTSPSSAGCTGWPGFRTGPRSSSATLVRLSSRSALMTP